MKVIFPILMSVLFLLINCQVSESVGSASTSLNGVSTSSNSISKISDSVQSLSGSIQSISGSSSGGSKAQMQTYKMDVRDLTAIYYQTGFNHEFKKDLNTVAQKNGLLEWQTDALTYIAIGEGLKKANMSEYDFKVFLSNFESKKELGKFLKEGYTSL